MSNSSSTSVGTHVVGALVALVAIVAGLPALLLAVAVKRFGHLSPLDGMRPPWNWSTHDVQAWARQVIHGLDSSGELVDLFFRIALVVGWTCLAILLYTVIDECWFQMRHGMPSAHRRRMVGLGPLGRHLASVLVALLPLSASTVPPALAASMRVPTSVVMHRHLPDRDDPIATPPVPVEPTVASAGEVGGWSLVEVQRGDSVWAIAERFADGRDVAGLAKQIVAANLGTVMSDGHRFATPALIEPGWMLSVPTSAVTVVAAPAAALPIDGYVVRAGDSYWDIAEHHMDAAATGSEIAAYAQRLMAINAPLLGYSDARLVRPGDMVQLGLQSLPDIELLPPLVPSTVADPLSGGVALGSAPVPVPVPAPTIVADPPLIAETPAAAPPAAPWPPPVPDAPKSASVVVDHTSDDNIALGSGLGAAIVLAGGAVAALASRRRQQLRGAHIGTRLVPPTPQAVETEKLLRSLNATDRLARIDLALRCATLGLAGQRARPLALEIADDGAVRLYTDRPATTVPPRWLLDDESGAWRLPADVALAELADDARRSNQPCPAIVHLGTSAGGHLFVDLEAVGSLSIDARPEVAAAIVRCAAASLAVSPFAESSRVLTFGLGPEAQLGSSTVEAIGSIAEAVELVKFSVDSIAGATDGSDTTFALRAAASGGEAWEPTLLLAVGIDDPAALAALVSAADAGGRGVGVLLDRPVPGARAVLRAADDDFVLEPLGRRVTPVGLTVADVSAVDDLLEHAERLLPKGEEVNDRNEEERTESEPTSTAEFREQEHELVVHVLGHVAVQSVACVPVAFERSKAQELVVWLSQHRHRPTRGSARTALWDLTVRDATFSNVVSDARRAMAKVTPPPAGQEWIGRTMNEDLPLHDLVVSDAELLADRVAYSRRLDDNAAIVMLRPGVALIQGMPFAGTSYLWPDAEGITSALILLATTAAADLAARYLCVGDIDGVFWATGQGLKVLAGHEELIALRMRAHACRGDLAGVRSEWESYERALNADTWAGAEPSPKLVMLRRELLSPSMAV